MSENSGIKYAEKRAVVISLETKQEPLSVGHVALTPQQTKTGRFKGQTQRSIHALCLHHRCPGRGGEGESSIRTVELGVGPETPGFGREFRFKIG